MQLTMNPVPMQRIEGAPGAHATTGTMLFHEKVGWPERSEHIPLVHWRRGGQHFHFAIESKEIGIVPSLRLKMDALQAMNAPPAVREACPEGLQNSDFSAVFHRSIITLAGSDTNGSPPPQAIRVTVGMSAIKKYPMQPARPRGRSTEGRALQRTAGFEISENPSEV